MAFDFEYREGAHGAQAKAIATLSFDNGRTNLDDVTAVTWRFEERNAETPAVVSLTGAVLDSATMKVSLEFAVADWTTLADKESWLLTIDLTCSDGSNIPIPEKSKGYVTKFWPHPSY